MPRPPKYFRAMLLNKIQDAIQAYCAWLQGVKHHPYTHAWESLRIFQENWNLDTPDPAAMFGRSLHNSETRRLWQAEHWEPKRVMTLFWKFEPGTVRLMFEDLFQENREVDGRIGRFLFGCDTLMRDYKRAHIGSIENNHYHDDYRMIALYLSFRYPEAYGLYDFPVFQAAVQRLGARDIPKENDLPRYFKVLRTLMTFLEKDGRAAPALQQHLHPKRHFQGKTLLLAADFCRFVKEEQLPRT